MTTLQTPIARNHYARLPEAFYSGDKPDPVKQPQLLILNKELLAEYQLDADWFESEAGLAVLSGNVAQADPAPVAMAYAGHQFGHRVPLLGDGRAHMLGQLNTAAGLIDVQLKGSGHTRFSRGGDGRATLKSVLREYLISEAMAGLSIPTTRSLAVIGTGEDVFREYPEPGAILVRTARSHIRVGSFQHAANVGTDEVRALADHMIEHHYPELADSPDKYAELLHAAGLRQANLIAQWMLCGFIHGVMNTDNMSLVGETIDFGPCAFIDEFDPEKVFSSIDRNGRYAWARQPSIGLWNLTRFAETLLPLFANEQDDAVAVAESKLQTYMPAFQDAFYQGLGEKLAFSPESQEQADAMHRFGDKTLALMHAQSLDMTVFFDTLARVAGGAQPTALIELFSDADAGEAWVSQWTELADTGDDAVATMRAANPALIARNHQVEKALVNAADNNDFTLLHRLAAALKNPYEVDESNLDLKTPPQPAERVQATFCGT